LCLAQAVCPMTGALGRRPFFALIFAALAGQLRPSGRGVVAAAQPRPVSVDQFLALSSRLIGHRQLDATLARTYLDAILAVPQRAALLERLVNDSPRTAGHAALERDIIASWYTGVHEVGGAAQVATHAGALVWQVIGRPATGMCAGAMGDWAQPPTDRV
jgi:hypothetical protein